MIPDEVWVQKAAVGDLDAFDMLVKKHQGRIYGLAYRMLGNVDDAYDAVQETFLEAFKSLPSFEHRSKFSTWLYRVAINTCQQWLRRTDSRRRTLNQYVEYRRDVSLAPDLPEEAVLKTERYEALQEAILKLPEKQRSVVVLFYMQQLKYREIADILGCSEGTVASRLNTAIRNLGGKLRKTETDL